jgi:hypothetical protein
MFVFLHATKSPGQFPVPEHYLRVCPAGHLPHQFVGDTWWDASGDKLVPREFTVKFERGRAEVSDELGRYLIDTGQAQRTKYIKPAEWDDVA